MTRFAMSSLGSLCCLLSDRAVVHARTAVGGDHYTSKYEVNNKWQRAGFHTAGTSGVLLRGVRGGGGTAVSMGVSHTIKKVERRAWNRMVASLFRHCLHFQYHRNQMPATHSTDQVERKNT